MLAFDKMLNDYDNRKGVPVSDWLLARVLYEGLKGIADALQMLDAEELQAGVKPIADAIDSLKR